MIRLAFLACFGLSGVFLPISLHADTIKLCADYWFPYNGTPTDENPGFVVELAKAAFATQEHTVSYSLVPWARCLREVHEGKIDGAIGVAKSEAPELIFPEHAQGEAGDSFFTLATSSWEFTGPQSLTQIRLGYILDYSYGDQVDAHIEKFKADSVKVQGIGGETPLEQNIKKLTLGRIDVVVSNPFVMRATLKQEGYNPDLFREVGPTEEGGSDDIYIAFSPKNKNSPSYARLLSSETKKAKESGAFAKLLERYGLSSNSLEQK